MITDHTRMLESILGEANELRMMALLAQRHVDLMFGRRGPDPICTTTHEREMLEFAVYELSSRASRIEDVLRQAVDSSIGEVRT